jgi:hypothetical protein
MNFVMLYTKDGQCFFLNEKDYAELRNLRYDDRGFSIFHIASSGIEVYLRVEEIQSFMLSTPESRAAAAAWEQELHGVPEKHPWE